MMMWLGYIIGLVTGRLKEVLAWLWMSRNYAIITLKTSIVKPSISLTLWSRPP